MREIFISYRRVDTEAAGGHLYDNLRSAFGDGSVFMDTRPGGIPWGADWEKSLNQALEGCLVLIALIGPQWESCERSPGLRRLDAPDDWVRGEIVTALRQGKLVVPVLLQREKEPGTDQLPPELREHGFPRIQAYPVRESDWEAHTRRLFDVLATIPRLRQLHDLASGETGIRLLEKLIRDNPFVADAVSRSRAVIETTDREVDEIRLLKGIHDALHQIESNCLIPMGEMGTPLSLDGSRRMFVRQDHAIRGFLCDLAAVVPQLPVVLDVDLPGRLTAASAAFEVAVTSRAPDDHDRVVGNLEELAGDIPVCLNDAIEHAAMRLELRQLQELMARVGELLGPAAARDTELTPMLAGIAALDHLHGELELRVREHGLLQTLDSLLRQVASQRIADTSGRIEPSTLVPLWNRIRTLRGRFQPPFSGEMEEGHHILEALEPGIGEAVGHADEPEAVARLHAYAHEVGELFREVDSKLKEFCFELREKTSPLKTILAMSRVEVQHA